MTADIPLEASIRKAASAAQRGYLDSCVKAASRLDLPLYLVGGVVRDFLLTGELLEPDLDMVTEGDALALAEEVAHRLGGSLKTHSRFLTAEVVIGGTHIDLVTARRERYETPASLPIVSPGDLETDLARRDFSVNAMAVPLWPTGDGALIDPFGGATDLERHRLRVLHERSFFDDPTRILRGVRIGARLDLQFARSTSDLARAAIGADAFGPLSASRLRHELLLLLEDPLVDLSLRWLEELGFLALLGRNEPIRDSDWGLLKAVQDLQSGWDEDRINGETPRWWLVYLMSLSWDQDPSNRVIMARRLGLDEQLTEMLLEYPGKLRRCREALTDSETAAHEVCAGLDSLYPEEFALLLAGAEGRVATWIDRWVDELCRLDLMIDGSDLKEAGFVASPEIGRALKATLEARLDGLIDASEELPFAIDRLRGESE